MFAARQRALCAARQLPRSSRTYASDAASGHGKPAEVNESFGKGSIATVGVFLGGVLVYQFAPKEGETSAFSNLLEKYRSRGDDWADVNALHTKAMEQAAYDRNLFENAGSKQQYVDLTFPEVFQSHAPRNIKAGQLMNIDHMVEHYRQQHIKEEERKAKILAEKTS